MRKSLLAVCGVILGLGAVPAFAQSDAPAAQAQQQIVAPGRGMSAAQVQKQFGAPAEKIGPVGKPPISRWVYPTFVVYFEGHHVIHSVATDPGTVPGK